MKNNITLTIHPATIFLVHFIFFLLYIIPKIIDNNGIGKTIKTIQPYSNVNGSGIWKSSIINDIIYNPIQIEAMENTNTNVKKISIFGFLILFFTKLFLVDFNFLF